MPVPSLLRSLALLACLGPALPAATTLTVHNQTGLTLAVTRPWSPWRPEPDDPPMTYPFFRRWLKPGEMGVYRCPVPGKELESHIVIRRLPQDGVVAFEGMTIQAMDPLLEPFGAEPEAAPPIMSRL